MNISGSNREDWITKIFFRCYRIFFISTTLIILSACVTFGQGEGLSNGYYQMRYTRYEPEQDISLRFTMLYNTSTEEGKQAFPDWANDNLINVEMPEFGSGINNINNRSNGQNIITNINLKRQA